MPRKKSAPRKPPEKAPPPEPKRRGRRKKAAEPQPAEPAEPAATEDAAPSEPHAAEPESVEAEPAELPPAGPQADASATVTADEAALVAKYGTSHQIVPGSLRYAGGRENFKHKRTVEVQCCACPAVRVVATSDLQWDTTRYCLGCVAAVKRNRRAAKRRAK